MTEEGDAFSNTGLNTNRSLRDPRSVRKVQKCSAVLASVSHSATVLCGDGGPSPSFFVSLSLFIYAPLTSPYNYPVLTACSFASSSTTPPRSLAPLHSDFR